MFQKDFFIQCLFQGKIIYLFRVENGARFSGIGIAQNSADVYFFLGRGQVFFLGKKIRSSHQFVNAAYAQLRHIFPQFFRDETHEVSAEPLAQLRVLGCHAHGAGVQVADTHHDTAHGDERSRGKAEFFRTQNCGNRHIPAAHQLTVGFNAHPLAQAILDKCLMGFREPQLPGKSRIMDGALGSGSCSSVIAGNQDDLCAGFGNACRYGAHSCFGYQFHGNSCIFVGVFQIIDQLRQILDRINVVVRGRGNQADAGCGVPCFGNPRVYFSSGQMAAFAGFCSLRHFDLDFLGAYQILAGNAESAAGNLLDGRTAV